MADPDADLVVLARRKPPVFSLRTLAGVAVPLLYCTAGFLSAPLQRDPHALRIQILVFAAILALLLLLQIWLIRRRGAGRPITVDAAAVTLPTGSARRRSQRVPLAKIRSVVTVGRGWNERLVVDTGLRAFAYPTSTLADGDAEARLRAAIAARRASLPDAAALDDAMQRRHSLAEAVAHIRPWGTRGMVLLICVSFAWQVLQLRHRDMLGLADLGAGAPILIWQGQWYRLVAANLLHATPQHLLGNALSLLVIGAMIERLAGWRHSLVLLLGTCMVAQATSAALASVTGTHLYAVGISGGIFGLLGALGVITWRFGASLPAGLRIPARGWFALLVINAVVIPLAIPQVDWLAHAGGAVAGFAAGALLCRGITDVAHLRRPRAGVAGVLALLAAVWAGGAVIMLVHAASPAARLADRAAMTDDLLARAKPPADVCNVMAWTVAADPASPKPLLRRAADLARQAVEQQGRLNPKTWSYARDTDTLAAVEYRLGESLTAALDLSDGPWRSQPYGTHFAQFLDRSLRDHGAFTLGGGPSATAPYSGPAVTIDHGLLRLTLATPLDHGGRLYAGLYHGGDLAGVLFFRIPPGFAGAQILPLPTAQTYPHSESPPALWTDGTAVIKPALYDRRGCFCAGQAMMGPNFAPYVPDTALPPV